MKISVLGLCGHSVFLKTDHFHSPGETIIAQELYTEPGGKGFNQAVAAARLGAQVNFFTCVGNDEEGRDCLSFLKKEGVVPYSQISSSQRTAYADILSDKTGESRITVYQGASRQLAPQFIFDNESVLAQSDMLLLNNEYPEECNYVAIKIGEKYGIPIILNPAPAYKMDKNMLRKCFLLTPNISEAAVMLGESEENVENFPRMFKRHGINTAVVTLGSQGALLIENGKSIKFPSIPSDVKDTTGAGDTFNAALAVAIGRGMDLSGAVEYGINASALSVRKKYVMPGMPTKKELEENFIKLQIRETER